MAIMRTPEGQAVSVLSCDADQVLPSRRRRLTSNERTRLHDRITELEVALAEALDYVPPYFREKWKLDDPLRASSSRVKGADDA